MAHRARLDGGVQPSSFSGLANKANRAEARWCRGVVSGRVIVGQLQPVQRGGGRELGHTHANVCVPGSIRRGVK